MVMDMIPMQAGGRNGTLETPLVTSQQMTTWHPQPVQGGTQAPELARYLS